MREARNILSVVCGYAAAVIGAGFASGQEIISFFVRYGRYSIIGVALACVVFVLFAYAVLCSSVSLRSYVYGEYLAAVMERGPRRVTEAVTAVFSVSTVCVMTACAGEMGFVLFGLGKFVGAAVFAMLCGVLMLLDRKKIMAVNSVMGAVIVFGIIFSALYILRFREHQTFSGGTAIAVSGVSYAGYNLLTSGAVLTGMSRILKNRREAAAAAVLSGAVLFIMMSLIWGILSIYYGKINLGELPMLTMALRQNAVFGKMYSALLFMAILSTGTAGLYGIYDMTDEGPHKYALPLTILTALAFSGAGVANLIDILYRICGWAGGVIAFFIIVVSFKNTKNEIKQSK